MSSSTIYKKKRDVWKKKIFDFIENECRKEHAPNQKRVIEFCKKKIGIEDTASRKIINELEREGKIKFVKLNTNENYYYIGDHFNISYLPDIAQKIFFKHFDIMLDNREPIFNQLKPEEQAITIKLALRSLLKFSNLLMFSQAVSNPKGNSNRMAFVEIKKRMQRLYRIHDTLPEDSEIRAWFLYLLFGYKGNFGEFMETMNSKSPKDIAESFLKTLFVDDFLDPDIA